LLAGDPSPLLGTDVAAAPADVDGLLARRDAVFAGVQEHYYAEPMRVERGWQHLLLDTDGRAYVDMVNNVAAVGHGHPRLADAVERQMRMLNTNSRFHYESVAALSERLVALAPDGLDTVFLVNSGSEAVDLALRIAQVVTDRQDVVATHESYHGWTYLSDAVTTSLYDNPRALETRPDWVHLASAPNPFRGRFRGADAGAAYGEELRQLVERIASEGRAPAAYICEPVLGNAGGVMLPAGYLAAAYDAVRSVGGLCIADEVQVGYGRTGHHWWAYEMHGVTPDIITIAKAMGNGQPLGAVITSRAVADAFAAQGSFFSSAGGSPVSCVVGLTVLDNIEDEQLQQNAAEVGDHLIARCTGLMDRHPMIGAVHGMGLYLGVELVHDRETLDPATAECYAICDRLRELGIIVQPTGERANVLKMKPPMCLTREAADFYVDMLEKVLVEGW
jgi:4-aminobutyrate aminotransferase-like enzyme